MQFKKIILKITLLFIICTTFITSKCITGKSVIDSEECTGLSEGTHLCCMISAMELKMCLSLAKKAYNGLKAINFGGFEYNIECNQEKELQLNLPGSPCGLPSPASVSDCRKFSSEKNSCCYYKHTTFSSCYNLGVKWETNKVDIGGFEVQC